MGCLKITYNQEVKRLGENHFFLGECLEKSDPVEKNCIDYYPGGSVASHWEKEPYRFGYQGEYSEEDQETGFNHFEARKYDSKIGRWTSVDPARQFASPYNGMGNNPVLAVDPDGRKIRWNLFRKQNKEAAFDAALDMEEMTGLIVFEDADGNLSYIDDFVSEFGGSETARMDLVAAIDDPRTLAVVAGGRSAGAGLSLMLSPSQIQSFTDGTSRGLNKKTMGLGMTFLHELHHTDLGINFGHNEAERTQYGVIGNVVNRMNTIRSELGANWGQRLSYRGTIFQQGGRSYLPFDRRSSRSIGTGRQPSRGSMYIEF